RRGEFAGLDLERAVAASAQLGDAGFADVEAHRVVPLAELDGERKPDIPQADDRDARGGLAARVGHGHVGPSPRPGTSGPVARPRRHVGAQGGTRTPTTEAATTSR